MSNLTPTPHERAALRDGTLSLILRPVVPQPVGIPEHIKIECHDVECGETGGIGWGWFDEDRDWLCPLGWPGDVLAVREDWVRYRPFAGDPTDKILYRADLDHCGQCPVELDPGQTVWCSPREEWQPADTMPKWAVRYRLHVVSVRCLRIKDLTKADAKAHGPTSLWPGRSCVPDNNSIFCALSLDHPGGTPLGVWSWVWAVSVEVVA